MQHKSWHRSLGFLRVAASSNNPVKHGLVRCVANWPYSTFHRLVKKGIYQMNWAGGNEDEVKCDD